MEDRHFTLKCGSELVVTRASDSDGPALLDFLPDAFEETDCLIMTRLEFQRTVATTTDFLGKIAASRTHLALIARIDGQVVGILTCTGRDLERVRHTGEVGLLVGRRWWGRGIGKSLMQTLHEWALANPEITKLDLRVRLSNHRAISLYERLGYQVEGWIRRAVRLEDGYDDHYWMGLELPLDR